MISASDPRSRGRARRFAACACFFTTLALGGAPARAEVADALTRTAARELAMEGASAFDRRDYPTALDRFRRAYALFRAPSLSVMEARTLLRLGRFVEALDKYEETLRIPLATDAPEAFRQAANDAAREVEDLRARVPRMTIYVRADAPTLEKTEVWIDGKLLPRVLWGVAVPVDPGSHTVTAGAGGKPTFERGQVLREGAREMMTVDLGEDVREGSAQRKRPRWITSAAVGWAAVGLGATAWGTSAVTGIIALNKKSDLDSTCDPGCPSTSQDDIDSFRLNRNVAYISFGVGAAALAAGGYLLLSGTHNSTRVGAVVTPMGAKVVGAF